MLSGNRGLNWINIGGALNNYPYYSGASLLDL